MGKVQPSDSEMGGVGSGAAALGELVRLATGLIVQEGLEAEQAQFIGRAHYERGTQA